MYYTFVGKTFFYTKFCDTLEKVAATIDRNKNVIKMKDFFINKRINKVLDNQGIVIYPPNK